MFDSRSVQEKLSTFALQMAANPDLLSTNLKATRKARRLTLQQAAERAHVSVRTISKWESGEIRSPNWDNLERYARVLKVDLLDLLDDPDAIADDSPSVGQRLDTIEAKLDELIDFLKGADALAGAIDRRREEAAESEHKETGSRSSEAPPKPPSDSHVPDSQTSLGEADRTAG